MTSYDNIRQSFVTWTERLSIFYFINAFGFLITSLGSLSNKLILEKQPELLAQFGESELQLLKQAATPIALVTFTLGFFTTLTIAILLLYTRQKARLKQDKHINIAVFYIAIIWSILSIPLEILYLGTLSLLSPIFMLIFGFSNLFTLHKAQLLRDKE